MKRSKEWKTNPKREFQIIDKIWGHIESVNIVVIVVFIWSVNDRTILHDDDSQRESNNYRRFKIL